MVQVGVSKWGYWLVILVVVLIDGKQVKGCIEEERKALLDIRASLKSFIGVAKADPLLPTWVDDSTGGCCEWEGVTCNHTTGHVTQLSLESLTGIDDSNCPSFYDVCRGLQKKNFLNISRFHHFKELQNLSLYNMSLGGWIGNEGFESRFVLKKLERFNLAHNLLNNSNIIPSLSELPSLKVLNISWNELSGSIPAQALANLENLEILDLSHNGLNVTSNIQGNFSKLLHLDLSWNEFNKYILKSLSAVPSLQVLDLSINEMEGPIFNEDLPNLPNLEVLLLGYNYLNGSLPLQGNFSKLLRLDLSFNRFNKRILKSLSVVPSLQVLDLTGNFMGGPIFNEDMPNLPNLEVLILGGNYLNGTLPLQGFCELKNLQELDLGHNRFEGVLPPCLSNFTSLRLLDLSWNQFTGNLSSSMIASLTSLEYIDLSDNKFEGLFSLTAFSNHTKLEAVQLSSDNIKFKIETENSDWIPSFQLKLLVLIKCNLTRIPNFLHHQRELQVLDLSHNMLGLEETFPNWLIENTTRLRVLNLRNNSLDGIFSSPTRLNQSIVELDISGNHLRGHLPEDIGQMFPYLRHLNLSSNAFNGSLPISMGNLSELEVLDLSRNNFSGEVPKSLFVGCLNLLVLQLSSNRFHGQISSRNFSMNRLRTLLLSNNNFTGTLPNLFSESTEFFDISNNSFSGVIPRLTGNLTSRQYRSFAVLVLRDNFFEGQFPCQLVPSWFLDISHNKFSGSLPTCSNLQSLAHLHLESNRFTGSVPQSFRELSNLLTLDISENNLSGSIPDYISELSNLRILLLRGNNISGSIPNELCRLSNISFLDLSSNCLSGTIPHCLQNIGSYNDLAFVQSPSFFLNPNPYDTYVNFQLIFSALRGVYANLENYKKKDEVEFITKGRSDIYKGAILDYMSGLDLSCNNLTGEIPQQLGLLVHIHALNLSHNHLTGPIPSPFSKLAAIESLDLSWNNLSGKIPSELTALHSLEFFRVGHNNLSGRLPEMKDQFGTFSRESYEGNPFLCGEPLERKCITSVPSPPRTPSGDKRDRWYDIDMVSFTTSCTVTCVMFWLGFAGVLYINPYWRRRWFNFIEECMYSCYYFFCDSLRKLYSRSCM